MCSWWVFVWKTLLPIWFINFFHPRVAPSHKNNVWILFLKLISKVHSHTQDRVKCKKKKKECLEHFLCPATRSQCAPVNNGWGLHDCWGCSWGLGQTHLCWQLPFIPFSIHGCAVWTFACQEEYYPQRENNELIAKRNKLNIYIYMHIYVYIMLLLGILKGKPSCGRTRAFGAADWATGLCWRVFIPEDEAAAVSDSEDGLVVVKILSVPMVFMKKFYVLAKIWVGNTSALKISIYMDYLTPKGCLIISTTDSPKVSMPRY